MVSSAPERSSGRVPLLSVQHLTIGVRRGSTPVPMVHDVSFEVHDGMRFGLVGESGSGKSMTLKAIAGLLPRGVAVLEGKILFRGDDILAMSGRDRRHMMGPKIAMIFQEPMTALNPTMRVGRQIAEGPRRHLGLSKSQATELAVEMMRRTGIPDPARRARAYPHELSGGLRQRVMIAMAVACEPDLVLCDEPTTALDVTVQDQVLRLLAQLCDDLGSALTFVTHDLAVVSQTCSRLSVMYGGRIMEQGAVRQTYQEPRHPYTEALLQSAPDFDKPEQELSPIPGLPPTLTSPPPGCPFAPRCRYAVESCTASDKELIEIGERHSSACDQVTRIYGDAS